MTQPLVQIHDTLYTNPKGLVRDTASYSARQKFKHCRRLFKLSYVDGWRQRTEGVSTVFGDIVEKAWMHSVKHKGQGGPSEFTRLWHEAATVPGFEKRIYRGAEESFSCLMRSGQEMMRIFEIRFASYPFQHVEFQVPLKKKIFPGTSYDSLKNVAYVDAICSVDENHPALPPPLKPGPRSVIVDCKTSGEWFPEKLICLDPQLIEYGWMHPASDTFAFLNFIKDSHGFKSGSRVTLLESAGAFEAGREVAVLDKANPLEVWIGTPSAVDAYDKACRAANGMSLKGNALTAAAENFLALGVAVKVPNTHVSKQRVQFVAATIHPDVIAEAGKVIGQTTVEMVFAHEQDFYPMEPGLRYPDKKCRMCDMRSICSGDNDLRDKSLKKVGEEWLDSLVEG